MMKRTAVPCTGALLCFLLIACNDDSNNDHPPAGTPALLVVNSLGETMDVVDLLTGTVSEAVATLGDAPNDVVYDAARQAAWVVNSSSNDVWEIDLGTFEKGTVFDLGAGSNPYFLRLLSDRRLAVTNLLSGDVAWLDPDDGSIGPRQPVGQAPEALLETGGHLYAALTAINFTDYHYATGEVVQVGGNRVAVGTNPQGLVRGPDGRIHVLCTGNYGLYEPASFGEIHVLDATTLAPEDTIAIGDSPAYAMVSGNSVYVTSWGGGLAKYNGTTHQVLRGFDDPVLSVVGLGAMALDGDHHRLYVAGFDNDTIYVVDTAADTLVTTYEVGDGPVAVALGRIPE